jgi:hypothetical protein
VDIPTTLLPCDEALTLEPRLNPNLLSAVRCRMERSILLN